MLFKDFKTLERLLGPVKISNLYHFKPFDKFSIDSRTIEKGQGFVAVGGKHCDGHDFILKAIKRGASFIVASKDLGTKYKIPFFIVEDTHKALGKIVRYIRERKAPFVYGITGSIGKTTTKEMLSFLLGGKFKVLKSYDTENNFLGVSKALLSLDDEEVVTLELGTSYPGEIEALSRISSPDAGIITFIKPAHLQGLADLSGVFREKTSILRLNPKIKAVLNNDDPYLRKVKFKGKTLWFGRNKQNDLYFRLSKQNAKESLFLVQDKYELVMPTQFCGFVTNAMAAIAGAYILGGSFKEYVDKMNGFRGFGFLRMQMQSAGRFFIINDAYNANPYSFVQALKVVEKYSLPKIAVVGDMLELGRRSIYYHRGLASHIIKAKFDYCLAMGEFTPHLIEKLKSLGYRQAFHFLTHEDIGRFIKRKVKKRHLIFLKGSRKMELEKVMEHLLIKGV
ncbi:MAG: UDP-N-acetylmuramoyl-tripeptide--D-alanyl-D-alanine ligase [Candidatus Omnitrophota bacterium]|nr:MAG: UDP-N-acetylmuramoyl-tripeptide--D-alanyl-D-alanine ligase [Candidatus Omnitrophota bacterium]